jgi:Zn-dependent M16 (insulinase) family peptidase
MSDFETLKAGLKDKWLDYYEVNQDWIKRLISSQDALRKVTQDSYEKLGTRPNTNFILGVISTLEPKLKEILYYFSLVSRDSEATLKAIELNFDPSLELEKRAEERSQQAVNQLESQFSDPELEEIRRQIQTS